jgi:hypothetical protein
MAVSHWLLETDSPRVQIQAAALCKLSTKKSAANGCEGSYFRTYFFTSMVNSAP